MTYIQKVVPPPNKILSFNLKNFAGGLNNRSDQLEDNQASSLLNMMFADETLMERRYGQEALYEISEPPPEPMSAPMNTPMDNGDDDEPEYFDKEIVLIDEYKPYDYDSVLVLATNDFLYLNNDVLTDIYDKPCGINHLGYYIFVDGDKMYAYGYFDQDSTTHRKVIGNPINDFVLLEIVSPDEEYTPLDTDYVRGVLNIDYEEYKIYYEPCQMEIEDTFKGVNVVPDGLKYLVSHNGRVFASGCDKDDDNVFITDIHNPFYFPVSLPIQLPPTSDEIKGLIVYDNAVIIGRSNDIYAIYGSTNRTDSNAEPFSLRKLNTHAGIVNNDTIDVVHNYLFYLGSDCNIYYLESSSASSKHLMSKLLSRNIDIEKEPINLCKADMEDSCSVFNKDLWYLSIGDKVLVYSYRQFAWTMYNNIDAKCYFVKDNELIWGTSDGVIVAFNKDDYLDFNEPYKYHWHSKFFDMDEVNIFKHFKEFYLIAHTYNDYPSDVSVTFEIDYEAITDRVIISNKLSIWGKSVWGDRFIVRNINDSLPFIIGKRGRLLRFKFSNGYWIDGDIESEEELDSYLGKSDGILVRLINDEEDEIKYFLYMDKGWHELPYEDLNKRIKIYEICGDYELRGKRR